MMRAAQNAAKNLTNFGLVFSVQLFEPFGFATKKFLKTEPYPVASWRTGELTGKFAYTQFSR